MTKTERKVVEILISQPKTYDAWKEPIDAVAKVMSAEGWDREQCTSFVLGLVERKLARLGGDSRDVNDRTKPQNRTWWETDEEEMNAS